MNVWFITGASRGFGLEVTRQALGRGDQVAATARHPRAITEAIPDAGDSLLTLPPDVTDAGHTVAAVSAPAERFGRIDWLVNDAGRGLLGADVIALTSTPTPSHESTGSETPCKPL
jgi:NAD(P)-dependent dehydrogenase (short-subunit alcohol dehydrogenase family)